MSAVSNIEWTDRTWNPTRGCSIVSPGCVNCYAMKFAHRFSGEGKAYQGLTKQTKAGPQWTGKVTLVDDALKDPIKWRKPQRVFVNSMSDLFHGSVPFEFVDRVFAVMAFATQHTFQILTKRPDRLHHYMSLRAKSAQWWKDAARSLGLGLEFQGISLVQFPLPNVWLGVSCEDQQRADERIPLLLRTPAAVRFVSAEPLLGHIRFDSPVLEADSEGNLDWVIVGGESGPGARPCDIAWIRSLVSECAECQVSVFVKQLGAKPILDCPEGEEGEPQMREDGSARYWAVGFIKASKGSDPSEWPADLRIREFPSTEASR